MLKINAVGGQAPSTVRGRSIQTTCLRPVTSPRSYRPDQVRFGNARPLLSCDKEVLAKLLAKVKKGKPLCVFSGGSDVKLIKNNDHDVVVQLDYRMEFEPARMVMDKGLWDYFQSKNLRQVTVDYHIDPTTGEINTYELTFILNEGYGMATPHPLNDDSAPITCEEALAVVEDALNVLTERIIQGK